MSIDGNLIHHLTIEWTKYLKDGRIRKIYQLSRFDLLFHVHNRKEKHVLLLSASPRYARMYLSKKHFEVPKTPPAFGMFLRKHLEGGIIRNIFQIKNDRIIYLQIDKRNEMGDITTKNLIIELMGKYANIILTDQSGVILDALKRSVGFEEMTRTIYPKAKYILPQTNKIDPTNYDKLTHELEQLSHVSDKTIMNTLMGFSPIAAKEVVYRYEQKTPLLQSVLDLRNNKQPVWIKGEKEYFYHTDLTHITGKRFYYNSVNELLDAYFYDRERLDQTAQFAKDLKTFIKNRIQRNLNKIDKLQTQLQSTDKMQQYRLEGEIIQANMYQIQKGQSRLETLNYYTNKNITISLNPLLTPSQNAALKFKQYRKIKNSIPHLTMQIKEAKETLAYFIELENQLEYATYNDISEIREELIEKRYLSGARQKRKNKKPNITEFTSPDGYSVLLGKNNMQNEYLTHHYAKPNDLWLHVQNLPGAHVIIKGSSPLPESTLRYAANLAAYFSKARHSSSVPVDYTLVKYVKKIPGKVGSFVRYKKQKTIYIDPKNNF